MTPVPMACCRTMCAVSVCPWSSEGPYPLTTIWTTALETFETTVSREVLKVPNTFEDDCSLETSAAWRVGPESVRADTDCPSAEAATKKQATTPYFIHCNPVIGVKDLLNPGSGARRQIDDHGAYVQYIGQMPGLI